jgi:hypothetical protein
MMIYDDLNDYITHVLYVDPRDDDLEHLGYVIYSKDDDLEYFGICIHD